MSASSEVLFHTQNQESEENNMKEFWNTIQMVIAGILAL